MHVLTRAVLYMLSKHIRHTDLLHTKHRSNKDKNSKQSHPDYCFMLNKHVRCLERHNTLRKCIHWQKTETTTHPDGCNMFRKHIGRCELSNTHHKSVYINKTETNPDGCNMLRKQHQTQKHITKVYTSTDRNWPGWLQHVAQAHRTWRALSLQLPALVVPVRPSIQPVRVYSERVWVR